MGVWVYCMCGCVCLCAWCVLCIAVCGNVCIGYRFWHENEIDIENVHREYYYYYRYWEVAIITQTAPFNRLNVSFKITHFKMEMFRSDTGWNSIGLPTIEFFSHISPRSHSKCVSIPCARLSCKLFEKHSLKSHRTHAEREHIKRILNNNWHTLKSYS